jgi:hypothetical protein
VALVDLSGIECLGYWMDEQGNKRALLYRHENRFHVYFETTTLAGKVGEVVSELEGVYHHCRNDFDRRFQFKPYNGGVAMIVPNGLLKQRPKTVWSDDKGEQVAELYNHGGKDWLVLRSLAWVVRFGQGVLSETSPAYQDALFSLSLRCRGEDVL